MQRSIEMADVPTSVQQYSQRRSMRACISNNINLTLQYIRIYH